jgi:hypothetical protein
MNALLDRMTPRDMAAVLLDALGVSDPRGPALRMHARLRAAEDEIMPLLRERLEDGRPAVRRKALAFIHVLELYPPGFSPAVSLRHEDADVRREALRVGLKMPGERERCLCMGLTDRDERVFETAINAARAGLPDAAVALVAGRLTDESLSSERRVDLIRLLGPVRAPVALQVLLRATSRGTNLFGRPRLQPKSPEMLVALATLARGWSSDSRASGLVARAKRSRDEDIRTAATGTA